MQTATVQADECFSKEVMKVDGEWDPMRDMGRKRRRCD